MNVNVSEHFANISEHFPKIAEDNQRLLKTTKEGFGSTHVVLIKTNYATK